LNNGARVEQINWEVDTSAKGLQQSAGMMVNYRYLLEDIDGNHESYRSGQDVSTLIKVKTLLKD
jgi:malonyl-CoA decarboxylase